MARVAGERQCWGVVAEGSRNRSRRAEDPECIEAKRQGWINGRRNKEESKREGWKAALEQMQVQGSRNTE